MWIGSCQFQTFGPYYYPTGDANVDNTFLIIGEWNSTHLYFALTVTGDSWFGFAFAQSAGCNPTNIASCTTDNQDAFVFGSLGGAEPLEVKEYTLSSDWTAAIRQIMQNLELIDDIRTEVRSGVFEYSLYFTRPYNPSAYGDRNSYTLPYPLAGNFCWLWAMGTTLEYPVSPVEYQGYQCINFGGTTNAPTPSPSYGPTTKPTLDPTPKPSKSPLTSSDTAHPSRSPTKEPTKQPTDSSSTPTSSPTMKPTPGPTVQKGSPTRTPTKKPTPSPSQYPTKAPTPEPTHSPVRPGATLFPSQKV